MARTRNYSIIVSVTVAAWSAGVGLSASPALAAPVPLEPTTECSEMAHPPAVQPGPDSSNPLPRPGQLGELTQQPGPETQMPMECLPIGHG